MVWWVFLDLFVPSFVVLFMSKLRHRALRIVGPCPISIPRDEYEGKTDFHCGHCQKQVYNLSEYTQQEALALVSSGVAQCATYRVSAKGSPRFKAVGKFGQVARAAAMGVALAACSTEVGEEAALVGEVTVQPQEQTPAGEPKEIELMGDVAIEPHAEEQPMEPLQPPQVVMGRVAPPRLPGKMPPAHSDDPLAGIDITDPASR